VTPKKVREGIRMTVEIEQEIQGESLPDQAASGVTNDDMLNKATVSKIVERERQKAFEKGKQEALMELQAQQQQQEPQVAPQQAQGQNQGLGGMQQFSQADIERMISEQAPKALQEQMEQMRTQQTVNTFVNKMQQAEQKYPGIQEKLNDLDYSTMAPLIQMANEMPNTGDIMQELVTNPMKMGNLLMLMHTQPRMAQKAMMDLSGSIKQNEDAKAQEIQAQDPMSQLKPSTSAGMETSNMSNMSTSDFRKLFK